MGPQSKLRMTVDEFLVWAEDRPGRYELVGGEVFGMSPERAGHARIKYRIQSALERAIERAGLSCEMLPDGMTVRVDADTAYEPDALVQCGLQIPDDSVEATAPSSSSRWYRRQARRSTPTGSSMATSASQA